MGVIIRLVPKYERERARLIREARAIYDSIFPSADPASERLNIVRLGHIVSGANAHRGEGVLLS